MFTLLGAFEDQIKYNICDKSLSTSCILQMLVDAITMLQIKPHGQMVISGVISGLWIVCCLPQI